MNSLPQSPQSCQPPKPTQTDRVFQYLRDTGSITPLDALREFGCMRLGARIWELRNERGVAIRTEYETKKNRYGDTTTYARYVLEP